jgi:hypothetical protein
MAHWVAPIPFSHRRTIGAKAHQMELTHKADSRTNPRRSGTVGSQRPGYERWMENDPDPADPRRGLVHY